MAEHKHAAVLRAIADKGLGAAQWQDNKGGLMAPWHDCDGFITPITHSFLAWRIKPERKPDVVRYVMTAPEHGLDHPDESLSGKYSAIKAIFDGETGKLKSAEVLP